MGNMCRYIFSVHESLWTKNSSWTQPPPVPTKQTDLSSLTRLCKNGGGTLPSMILAQISAPTPNWGQPPSTVIRWLVFITLASIVSTSSGLMLRRLITWKPLKPKHFTHRCIWNKWTMTVKNNVTEHTWDPKLNLNGATGCPGWPCQQRALLKISAVVTRTPVKSYICHALTLENKENDV